ncbi:MAG: hypothetical protein RM049_07485 [Nostoc sp. DedQUE04]|uniref:hypothetical protein n=1 Tax=Nostoc sp. DedQUE04 TaxID=3075390 RepID=UPI002AD54959|nr:hypothetical protein [Nostoc sp. DedQUE04]MDZ8135132.1 hypothetical protein [Nostoc sp. DedQUE04]
MDCPALDKLSILGTVMYNSILGKIILYLLFSPRKMRNSIRLSAIAGLAFLHGCTSSCIPSPNSTSNTNPISVANSFSGSDKYEVQWNGPKGTKIVGTYVIGSTKDLTAPSRVENVEVILPHKVSFSAPKQSIVSADGTLLGQGKLEIKIYKNGSECGKPTAVGSGAGATKLCQ